MRFLKGASANLANASGDDEVGTTGWVEERGGTDGSNGSVIQPQKNGKGATLYGLMMATDSPGPVGVRTGYLFTSAVVRANERARESGGMMSGRCFLLADIALSSLDCAVLGTLGQSGPDVQSAYPCSTKKPRNIRAATEVRSKLLASKPAGAKREIIMGPATNALRMERSR